MQVLCFLFYNLAFITGMTFEGPNSTTVQSTKELIISQFSGNRSHGQMKLHDRSFLLDRGYTNWGLATEIFEDGGDIEASTLQRELWVPFTFNQKKRFESDSREFLDTSGQKEFRQKEYEHNGKTATVGAYLDGNNNCTLGLSSVHCQNEWDIVFHNPRDSKWYHNGTPEEIAKYWTTDIKTGKPGEDELLDNVIENKVDPLLTEDCHPVWFVDRANAETSSAVDAKISVCKRAGKEL
mmetsp:Transcript_13971/g.20950  ORF Transcript_13971/g.20950 Transcript_13971/m.20950 type:complete len:238 (+) Transcript_13971:1297-2010(+)